MPHWRIWGWGLTLSTIPAVAIAQAPPSQPTSPSGWSSPWNIFRAPEAPPAPVQPIAPKPILTLSPESLVEILDAEQIAFARRLEVCTQLRKVAVEANRPELAEQADQLEQKAEAVYQFRLNRLGIKTSVPGSAPIQTFSKDTLRTNNAGAYVESSVPAFPAAQPNEFREVKQ